MIDGLLASQTVKVLFPQENREMQKRFGDGFKSRQRVIIGALLSASLVGIAFFIVRREWAAADGRHAVPMRTTGPPAKWDAAQMLAESFNLNGDLLTILSWRAYTLRSGGVVEEAIISCELDGASALMRVFRHPDAPSRAWSPFYRFGDRYVNKMHFPQGVNSDTFHVFVQESSWSDLLDSQIDRVILAGRAALPQP